MSFNNSSEDLFLTREEVRKLCSNVQIFGDVVNHTNYKNTSNTLNELGIVCTDPHKRWYNTNMKSKSTLKIVDKKKWFLTKIKYGI